MASAKATFSLIVVLIALALVGIGGAWTVQYAQTRAVKRDLRAAAAALDENRPRDAEQLLINRLDKAKPSSAWAPDALALRFRALHAMGDSITAGGLAQRILNPEKPWVRPGDEAWSRAHLVLANAALANGLPDQARQHLDAVLSQPAADPEGALLVEAVFGIARIELDGGKVEAGRDRLMAIHARQPVGPLKTRVEDVLGKVNTAMLFDPQPYGRDQIHVLEKGDSLDKLSKRYKVSADLLMGVNRISDPRKLRIGRRIKIPDLQLSLVVDKSNNTLTVYNFGKFFKRYTVRTGKSDYQTPVGDYQIILKAKDPTWFNRELNKTVPAGDPSNELGVRWMGFQGTSLGIHEARDPASLGKYSSNGCVGMRREDVLELYDMTPVGTPLKIQGQMNPALNVADPSPSPAGTVAPSVSPAPPAPASPTPANAAGEGAPLPQPEAETAPAEGSPGRDAAGRKVRATGANQPAFGQ